MAKNKTKNEGASAPSPFPGVKPAPPGRLQVLELNEVHQHLGPIPPAEHLAAYNHVVPGLADKIVEWADKELSHRHKLEEAVTEAEIKHLAASDGDGRTGLWLGFFLAVLLLAVSGIIAWRGAVWAAVTLATGTLGVLTSVFVYGSRKRKKKPPQSSQKQPAPTQDN